MFTFFYIYCYVKKCDKARFFMSKYKLILEYYLKGNNGTQIVTLCGCSCMIVTALCGL